MQASLFDRQAYVDITANYHGGNAESQAANVKAAPHKHVDRQRILEFMRRNGNETYVKEIIRELDMKHQTASARLSDLKADAQVVVTGEKREGCGVVRLRGI